MKITNKGRKLYEELRKKGWGTGADPSIDCLMSLETLSRLSRAATTYGHIQEIWCSIELGPSRTVFYEKKERNLELLITSLAGALGVAASFEGDPRGYTVRLHYNPRTQDDYVGVA